MILVAWWMPDYLYGWPAFGIRNLLVPILAPVLVTRFTAAWPLPWLRTKRWILVGGLLLLFEVTSIHLYSWQAHGNWKGYW